MSKMKVDFDEIEVISDDGLVMVSLDYIGEGRDGDYQPDDPDDYPHLRFDIYRKYEEGMEIPLYVFDVDAYTHGDWMAVLDASYCTALNANEKRAMLENYAKQILIEVESGVRDCKRQKRLYESLSWLP